MNKSSRVEPGCIVPRTPYLILKPTLQHARARLLASARAEAHVRSGSTESIPLGCPTIRPQILASSHPPSAGVDHDITDEACPGEGKRDSREKGTSLISTVCEGKVPRRQASKGLMQAA